MEAVRRLFFGSPRDRDDEDLRSQKELAFLRIAKAWNDALHDGIEPDTVANVALFKALTDLVTSYGEDAVADMVQGLVQKVRQGEFSLPEVVH